jgi:hypothetical protein
VSQPIDIDLSATDYYYYLIIIIHLAGISHPSSKCHSELSSSAGQQDKDKKEEQAGAEESKEAR